MERTEETRTDGQY